MNFKHAVVNFPKPIVLKDNFQLPVCFSGVYPVTDITCRPQGVDFSFKNKQFKDVDFNKLGLTFVN